MSGWNGALLGLKVKSSEKNLAKQYLEFLGANVDNPYFDEEIGSLSLDFNPGISGTFQGDSEDSLEILQALEKHFEEYSNRFYGSRKKKGKPFVRPDELYHLTRRVFSAFRMYIAYEAGNSVADVYYRYEAIYDSATGKKKEIDCYYCYGDGINVDTDDPAEEGKEEKESTIPDIEPDAKELNRLIAIAREKNLGKLADRLENPVKPSGSGGKKTKAESEILDYSFKIKAGELERIEGEGRELVIPEGVTSIGLYVFAENTCVETIIIPNSLKHLESCYFSGCQNLKCVIMPDALESIDGNPFMGCPSLCEIRISSNHSKFRVQDGVLFDSENGDLICYPSGKQEHDYVIPDGTAGIGAFAFDDAKALLHVSIPDSVIRMGDRVFLGCKHLTEIIVSADHPVFCVEDGVLINKNEKSIIFYPPEKPDAEWTVPDGMKKIAQHAFDGAVNLRNISIPDSVTEIETGAFNGCSALTSIKIPTGVDRVVGLFDKCSSLKEITILRDEVDFYLYGLGKDIVFKVPAGSRFGNNLKFNGYKVEEI